ncbi:MAG: ATP-dependent DNA helicase RecG [Candidatus Doudnabacteria bacterium RIFCSPHIGHO2_01_FULL_46_24]|uniref:ATP-dependent DNA helicase RecG n=1 Tax=Candidatus Doudnabacteria bacterium RIFCSPHIGHO2_01_FULL_46_24 TaxID=1817825 RepID=A0A1F5NW86_9BACT|nr:MAG: ATP-dependent DNA helicase RecG [Candidatus Doudnabacteria bacterium RIFCSPHIGHO2_01_FULL_46_24]
MDLKTPIENLYLVGPARAKILKKLGVQTLGDLLYYFPRAHQDLTKITFVKDLRPGEFSNIKTRVLEIKSFRTKVRKLTLTQALVEDDTGSLLCMWFNQPYLNKVIRPHETFLFSGKAVIEKNKLMLQNPIYEQEKTEQVHTARLVPIYPLTSQITQKQLRHIIKTYLDKSTIPEYIPEYILKSEKLLDEDAAVKSFHFPPDQSSLKRSKNRLAFDEIFVTQVRVLQNKKRLQKQSVVPISDDSRLASKLASLPFQLTSSQQQALDEITTDLREPYPANRLLEGDVGSGKTIVAALSVWLMAKHGLQAAILAPTEILAAQHYNNLLKFFADDGVVASLYTSQIQKINGYAMSRQSILNSLADGSSKIAFGTHALLEKKIKFKNLSLVVIDEQHRFGVEQRSVLKNLHNTHLLTMSATPIPRTLALTLYGDLDISMLKELPAGRQAIWTKIGTEENRSQAYEFIKKQTQAGRQAFVICPRVEESDKLGVKSATAEYKKLAYEVFPQLTVGLLHGKLKASEKEAVMQAFKDNEINILVASSVVEVGVDVPNATIMMIEGSERFGLAQLHQFRGRVGRSSHKSYCFLFTTDPENPRLQALIESQNGFDLAEKDLQIRGLGDLYGTEQSGYNFRIATLSNLEMVQRSRTLAEQLLASDPSLSNYPLLKQKIEAQPEVHLE